MIAAKLAVFFIVFSCNTCIFGQPSSAEQFKIDAYQDAELYFPGMVTKSVEESQYELYKGYTADLNGDGDLEWIVSGTLDQRFNYVLIYFRLYDSWEHQVVSRCVGGSILDIQIVDVDNDGKNEIYSVLQDADLKRYCRIKSMTAGGQFVENFRLDTPGGMYCSSNISLTRASDAEAFKVRVDEIEYPTDEDGDVRQTIYFYKIVDRIFVLDQTIGGRP